MSADNWGICPTCKAAKAKKADMAEKSAEKKYGNIPADAYMALMEEVANLRSAAAADSDERTLREDYELGVDSEGTFEVNYRASCQTCDFKFSFKHTCDAGAKP